MSFRCQIFLLHGWKNICFAVKHGIILHCVVDYWNRCQVGNTVNIKSGKPSEITLHVKAICTQGYLPVCLGKLLIFFSCLYVLCVPLSMVIYWWRSYGRFCDMVICYAVMWILMQFYQLYVLPVVCDLHTWYTTTTRTFIQQ